MGNTISYHDKPVELTLGDKGVIRGIQRDNKSRRFTGVPYALPPTGDYRWRKPRGLPSSYRYTDEHGGPYDATKFRAACPQQVWHVIDTEDGADTHSEDCLFVNIWTPVPAEGDQSPKKWPVMLWIHGGWFQLGDPSHEPGMDATEMISTGGMDAVVVAIGYRLNVFGFLAGQALLEDSGGEAGGNFGLWDQRLAAEWVKENIHFFGGDPDNITLAGRSAGAYSVEAQMLHEFRRPGPRTDLYRRVFMDSNAIPAQPKSLAEVEGQFDELCGHFGLDDSMPLAQKLSDLRSKTWKELLEAIPKLKNHTFRPITDELFLHSGMTEYLEGRQFADDFTSRGYKVLIGEVLNEETLYSAYNSPKEPTLDALRLQVNNYYAPDVTERVLKRYSLPTSEKLEDWQRVFGMYPGVVTCNVDGRNRANVCPFTCRPNHLRRTGARAIAAPGQEPRRQWRGHAKRVALSDCVPVFIHHRGRGAHVIRRGPCNGQADLEVRCSFAAILRLFTR